MNAKENGASYAEAAKIAHLPVSTFFYRYKNKNRKGNSFKNCALKYDEERKIVKLCKEYAAQGNYLTIHDLLDVAGVFIGTLPEARQKRLTFKNRCPGRKYARGFERRHSDAISFKRPSKGDAVRYAAMNAENLTNHIAIFEKIVRENNIDAQRMFNLDESGITPNRNTGRAKQKVYCTRSSRSVHLEPTFSNVDRVTLVAVVSASGQPASPFIIFQGTKLKYRRVRKVVGAVQNEHVAEYFPRQSNFTTRRDIAGVEEHNFCKWAELFVEEVKDLTCNGRKVLLVYDRYRSHMSFKALDILRRGNVVVYAPPAHTSGTI